MLRAPVLMNSIRHGKKNIRKNIRKISLRRNSTIKRESRISSALRPRFSIKSIAGDETDLNMFIYIEEHNTQASSEIDKDGGAGGSGRENDNDGRYDSCGVNSGNSDNGSGRQNGDGVIYKDDDINANGSGSGCSGDREVGGNSTDGRNVSGSNIRPCNGVLYKDDEDRFSQRYTLKLKTPFKYTIKYEMDPPLNIAYVSIAGTKYETATTGNSSLSVQKVDLKLSGDFIKMILLSSDENRMKYRMRMAP